MRVVHVFKDYFPPTRGGIEQHINDVTHSIKGYKFAVLTSSRSKKPKVDDDLGVRVVRAAERARFASTPITPSWPTLLRESGADLFHFHMPNPYGEVAFLRSKVPAPMIATYHADIIGRRALMPAFRPFQKRFISKAHRIVVSNPRLAATAEPLAGAKDRIVVIPFGVDSADWNERPAVADEIKERFPGPLLVSLGRLAYYKGIDVIIRAMRAIDATCLIIGDGPMRQSLEALAAKEALRHKIVFIGEIDDAARVAYYHAADAFLLPSTSRAEAFGISMLEAMACGTPAISTELGTGTSWLNLNNETGIVIEPNDVPALAGAIKSLLASPTRRVELGAAAAERVRQHFTRYQMLESLASLYASL
ncbi:MAG: glycosyltransferase [Actinomycetota bacterium]|nr:glycosyltransferase [Actinomycetota bacterium]